MEKYSEESSSRQTQGAFVRELKSLLKQFFLLNKRLLKKPSFIIILCMLPLLVFTMAVVSREDSGMITISLAQRDPEDKTASRIIGELDSTNKVIDFIVCETPDEAEDMVKSGKADAAWVFDEDTESHIRDFAINPTPFNAFIVCYEREDNPMLRIASEKLYTTIFQECTRPGYINFARENAEELNGLSDEELMGYFNNVEVSDDLFKLSYVDRGASSAAINNSNYLVTPLRGMLAVMMVLCGLAVSMFYLQDKERGAFVRITRSRRPVFSFIYHLTALFDAGVIVVISLLVSGTSVGILREVAMMLLYMLACTGFCILVRRLCVNVRVLGTVIPVIVIGSLFACPIFMNFNIPELLTLLIPTNYYLDCTYDFSRMLEMAIYTAVVFFVDYLLYRAADKYSKAGA